MGNLENISDPFPPMSNALSQRVAQLTKEYAEKHRVPYALARQAVAAEYPELMQQVREETLHRKVEILTIKGESSHQMVCYLSEHIARLAREKVAQKGISYKQALHEIGLESPELVRAARIQVLAEC